MRGMKTLQMHGLQTNGKPLLNALKLPAGLLLLALLLFDPAGALQAVREAMRVWADSVAPALFPFLAVLPLLTCPEARAQYARALGPILRQAFNLPGAAAAALAVGLLAGSPAGALACAWAAASLRRGELRRLALVCCGIGPVYLVSGVGVALLGRRDAGLLFAGCQLAAQLLTGLALRRAFAGDTAPMPAAPETRGDRPMRAAVLALLQIAGYMALFAVLAHFAGRLFGARAGIVCRMLLDMPGGAALTAGLSLPLRVRLPLLAGMSAFGGLCIAAQNLAVLAPLGVRWGEYLAAKAGQAACAAGLCAALLPLLEGGGQPVRPLPALPLAALLMAAITLPALAGFGGKARHGEK